MTRWWRTTRSASARPFWVSSGPLRGPRSTRPSASSRFEHLARGGRRDVQHLGDARGGDRRLLHDRPVLADRRGEEVDRLEVVVHRVRPGHDPILARPDAEMSARRTAGTRCAHSLHSSHVHAARGGGAPPQGPRDRERDLRGPGRGGGGPLPRRPRRRGDGRAPALARSRLEHWLTSDSERRRADALERLDASVSAFTAAGIPARGRPGPRPPAPGPRRRDPHVRPGRGDHLDPPAPALELAGAPGRQPRPQPLRPADHPRRRSPRARGRRRRPTPLRPRAGARQPGPLAARLPRQRLRRRPGDPRVAASATPRTAASSSGAIPRTSTTR